MAIVTTVDRPVEQLRRKGGYTTSRYLADDLGIGGWDAEPLIEQAMEKGLVNANIEEKILRDGIIKAVTGIHPV